ncbi:GNAT family N-acetyltransferase [Pseudalkalibacillus caeni]|uniref:GNAT family N-acetyltransferase n=1 Tax=Exobacillus caeni TaxID=2574798 RepID=A0A5R9F3Q6_9BACL|nr:GNAT family protein [Pseudalkalibacillus caeni]TLS35084.1 GNAT family N-acetyltransferase [Pseudalkalibacillus caeni]
MEKLAPVILSGKRVKIVPMEKKHVEGLFDAGKNEEIWTYMPMKVNKLEDMERLVAEALQTRKQGVALPFVIIDQDQQKIVGSTRFLDISIPNRNLEIGWTWLSPSVWQTMVNTECKYLLLRYCFEELNLVRVQLKADARNTRSCHAMERIGATKEGVLRKNRLTYTGYMRDSVYYSILDTEWPSVKEKLEGMLLPPSYSFTS